ncbi:MAG: hypothetical protein WAV15_01260 [Minisyncoccia bacterium]
MKNLNRLLGELAHQGVISNTVGLFLREFFEDMHLKDDIREEEITYLLRDMSAWDFDISSCSTDFLSGRFYQQIPSMLAKGAFNKNISSADLDKMSYIFCRVHGAIDTN